MGDGEDPLPDRLQGAERDRIEERLARASREASETAQRGISVQHEEVMGRGNRARRKRKFFDDPEKKGKTRSSQGGGEEKRQKSTGISNGSLDEDVMIIEPSEDLNITSKNNSTPKPEEDVHDNEKTNNK